MGTRISEKKRIEIVTGWNNGMSIFQICPKVQMETHTIKQVLKEANGKGELTRAFEAKRNNTLTRLRELIVLHPEGTWTIAQYAGELGVSEITVANYLYFKKDKGGKLLFGWTRQRKVGKKLLNSSEVVLVVRLFQDGMSAEDICKNVNNAFDKNTTPSYIKSLVACIQVARDNIKSAA